MTVRRSARFLGAALALGLGLPTGASAHAHLTAERPEAGAVVGESPRMLRLTFSEELELRFTSVSLTGPGKTPVRTEALSLDPASGAILIVPLRGPLPPGLYSVEWHATATDTHKTQGHYSFSVKP